MQAILVILLFALTSDAVQIPADPGLYYLNGPTRIEGRPVALARTGSRLKSSATLGIKSRNVSAQILGARAEHKVISTPVFYYRVAPGSETVGGVGDLVLVKLKRQRGHRQFEISAQGEWQAASGISLRSQVEFYKKQAESGLYKLVPARDLEPGEYGFYLFRGHDLPGLIYDFSVE